ncbi:MAG: YbjQ family protein [Betaproteobacteria bacterium]|nr:YbjQ family protein [Betaproteobacteria bacterium]MDH3437651.1 YbjQ family protein [Betaproteobacteria bacterium]
MLLIVAYSVGTYLERKHFEDIRAREARLQGFPVISFGTVPADWKITSTELVAGSVVVSLDYFKRIIASLRGLIGGRIKTYEPLLDRARREALLRMIEDAKGRGYDAVVNVRLETSRLASARRNGKGTAGVEMLAFGTAVSFAGR